MDKAVMRKTFAIAATAVSLLAIDAGIYARERLVTSGRVVLLELAPVDPRSLMQGDYMALRFAIANEAFGRGPTEQAKDGRIVAQVDDKGVSHFRRFADGTPPAGDEVLLRYRVRNGLPKFATNAFFFQEGQAQRYAGARYGEFRVSPDGEMILTRLRGADFSVLGQENQALK